MENEAWRHWKQKTIQHMIFYPSSGILNTTFRKLDHFPSSGEGETSTQLSPLQRANFNHWTFIKVKVTLRPTVSRPVRLGVRHPSRTNNQFFFLLDISFRQLRVCYFAAPSLTRGRVCNLLLLLVLASAMDIHVEVTLRPTVSRLVRLGVLPLLEQVTRCYIYSSDNYFLYFSCRALPLMRGRVCKLQCNDASSISSYIATDGLSASSSWCRTRF
jgi:hypothetical protein